MRYRGKPATICSGTILFTKDNKFYVGENLMDTFRWNNGEEGIIFPDLPGTKNNAKKLVIICASILDMRYKNGSNSFANGFIFTGKPTESYWRKKIQITFSLTERTITTHVDDFDHPPLTFPDLTIFGACSIIQCCSDILNMKILPTSKQKKVIFELGI